MATINQSKWGGTGYGDYDRGDLLVGKHDDGTLAKVSPGANGTVLVANNALNTGMEWRSLGYADISDLSTYTGFDARYYTETEVNNFFDGTTPITGYNKTNWDTAYGWGNHAGLYVPLARTITLNGTTNQISVSGGTQDLSANRIWTLSLPQDIHTGATPTFAGAAMTANISFPNNFGLTWDSGSEYITRKTGSDRVFIGINAVDRFAVTTAGLETTAAATASTPTHIPVFTANPSSTLRALVTRTPAEFLVDIGAAPADGSSNNYISIGSKTTAAATGNYTGDADLLKNTAAWTAGANKPTSSNSWVLSVTPYNLGAYGAQLGGRFQNIYFRSLENNVFGAWVRLWHSGDFNIADYLTISAAASTYEPAFSKNTAFNKNFGTTAGTVAEGNDSRILNGQTAYSWGTHTGLYPTYNGTGATGTWGISITGNAATVTNGVYTTGSYSNPAWITELALSKISGADDLKAIEALSGTSGLLRKTAANTWSLDTNTYLTSNQTITLSGDVTGSGTTAITTTIANNAVTTAKILNSNVTLEKIANIATSRLLGRVTASTGVVEELTAAQVRTLLNVADGATANTGTVTSVGLSVPTGFSVSGSPVTTAGTLSLTFAAGYSLPTTAKQTNWDTAYGWGNYATRSISAQHSLTGGGNLSADRTLSLVNDVASPGNNKLYGTNGSGTRGWYDVRGYVSMTNTGTTSNATYNSSTGVFNIPRYVGGTGTANRVAIWSGANDIASPADFWWDGTNKRLGLGRSNPVGYFELYKGSAGTVDFYLHSNVGYNAATPAYFHFGTENYSAVNDGNAFRYRFSIDGLAAGKDLVISREIYSGGSVLVNENMRWLNGGGVAFKDVAGFNYEYLRLNMRTIGLYNYAVIDAPTYPMSIRANGDLFIDAYGGIVTLGKSDFDDTTYSFINSFGRHGFKDPRCSIDELLVEVNSAEEIDTSRHAVRVVKTGGSTSILHGLADGIYSNQELILTLQNTGGTGGNSVQLPNTTLNCQPGETLKAFLIWDLDDQRWFLIGYEVI